MRYPIFVELIAKQDIREAREWLEGKQSGLGLKFRDELDEAFDRIASDPRAFAIVERRTRQVRLRNLTYVVSYICFENRVHVTAVLHGHRDPNEWKKRK